MGIHGLDTSVVDYVISYIPTYNQIINLDLLYDHEPDSYPLDPLISIVVNHPLFDHFGSETMVFGMVQI
jgi:hypothetical protein